MKKIIVALSILCLQACAVNERTKIIESNIKDMQVYAENGELICKELPCSVKFDEKTGQSQKVKLKVDGFEGDSDIDIKIWQGERNIRRAGSISNVVLYPISAADSAISGIILGPIFGGMGHSMEGGSDAINTIVYSPEGSTWVAQESFTGLAQIVNEIWYYDPDHIYINAELCNKNNQCVDPHDLGYKGYGYKTSYREDLIRKESETHVKLIKKDEIIIKRFVLHNYAELKEIGYGGKRNREYIHTLECLTGIRDGDGLEKIIDKSKSAPELAETLSRYPKKK